MEPFSFVSIQYLHLSDFLYLCFFYILSFLINENLKLRFLKFFILQKINKLLKVGIAEGKKFIHYDHLIMKIINFNNFSEILKIKLSAIIIEIFI